MELASYMKRKGYEWDSLKGNYLKGSNDKEKQPGGHAQPGEPASMAEILENILPLLKNLQNADQQPSISEETQSLPRYQVKGMYGTKAMRMANVLDELTRHFSKERNISQREIIEVALIEFFRKYGYRDEIEDFLVD